MMQKKNTIAEFISSEDADNFREEVQNIAGIKCYMATESDKSNTYYSVKLLDLYDVENQYIQEDDFLYDRNNHLYQVTGIYYDNGWCIRLLDEENHFLTLTARKENLNQYRHSLWTKQQLFFVKIKEQINNIDIIYMVNVLFSSFYIFYLAYILFNRI